MRTIERIARFRTRSLVFRTVVVTTTLFAALFGPEAVRAQPLDLRCDAAIPRQVAPGERVRLVASSDFDDPDYVWDAGGDSEQNWFSIK